MVFQPLRAVRVTRRVRSETIVDFLAALAGKAKAAGIIFGAQNCYYEPKGAFTGEVSITMLKDVGCDSVIIGHSERRHVFGETGVELKKKVVAALAGGIGCQVMDKGWSGIGVALLGAITGFAVFLLFYLLGGMGGGDVKALGGDTLKWYGTLDKREQDMAMELFQSPCRFEGAAVPLEQAVCR